MAADKLEYIGTWGMEYYGWYIGPVKDWQTRLHYGEEQRSGVGDLIVNNCDMIIAMRDFNMTDVIKHTNIFTRCTKLLEDGKRWPDEMNSFWQCKTPLCSLIEKTRFRIRKRRVEAGKRTWAGFHTKRRSQNDLTRDPFIAHMRAGLHLMWDVEDFYVKYPIRLWRPDFGAFMWYMRKQSKAAYRWFRITNEASQWFTSKKAFVSKLQFYMLECVEIVKERR